MACVTMHASQVKWGVCGGVTSCRISAIRNIRNKPPRDFPARLDLSSGCEGNGGQAGGLTMTADIFPFLKDRAFDAEATRVMGEAYDKARKALHDRGQPRLVQE